MTDRAEITAAVQHALARGVTAREVVDLVLGMAAADAMSGQGFERLHDLRRRHKAEVVQLCVNAIARHGSIARAAAAIGMQRRAVYRELDEGGVDRRALLDLARDGSEELVP